MLHTPFSDHRRLNWACMSFDRIDIDALRRGRVAKWVDCPPDVFAAWVADMDFPVAEPIRRAVAEIAATSDFGYPCIAARDDLQLEFAGRMQARFGWTIDPGSIEVLNDVVQGLHLSIQMFSEPGDAVVTPLPIYPPFLSAVSHARRIPVWQHFVRGTEGWRVDVERLEHEIPASTRILLVCNPHNPTGHVLDRSELERLAAIALERDLLIVSDEIHADLVYSGFRHTPIATLGPEVAERTITLTSASKAFNIAGLRCAVAVFGTQNLRRRFNELHPHARGGLNAMGLAATRAAWASCDGWLADVVRYLESNRDFLADHVSKRWPQVGFVRPEATYLGWLDLRNSDVAKSAAFAEPAGSAQRYLLEQTKVQLSDGADFGETGRGFVRLNFATSRAVLESMLGRMDEVLARLG
jgi:cystathionine beta-lyase